MDIANTIILAAAITAIIGPIIKKRFFKKSAGAMKFENCKDPGTINLIIRVLEVKKVTFDKVHFRNEYAKNIENGGTFQLEYNKTIIITRVPKTDIIVMELR